MYQLPAGDMWGSLGMTKVSIGLETHPKSWNVLFLLQVTP